ncbi:MAG: sterol desaturase family protein [Acetobacteraceae bacterium]|nr:sterol desaturase family protein [Acetobacteraceae bacterium]
MLADCDPAGLLLRVVRHLLRVDAPIGLASYLLVPIGAWLAYRQETGRNGGPSSLGGFVRYCVPLDVVTSRSCRIDLIYVSLKHFLNAWLLVPILVSSVVVTNLTRGFWNETLGSRPQAACSPWLLAFAIAACVLVQDFTQFLIHYAHHKRTTLWTVHKVHHSAETLTFGLSVKRTHMIEEAINLVLTSVVLGLTIGSLSYALGVAIWRSEMWGIDCWFLLSLFSFWHLRHSHMSLSYGWLEHVLQSPAQHQLHHSLEREHWDRNFGLLFSFWDKLFGCFLRSVDPGSYRVGLPAESRADYDSVLKLYVTPFLKIGEMVIRVADRGCDEMAGAYSTQRRS